MYVPKPFEVNDRGKLIDFIREHSFGILFSAADGKPFATHLPFLYQADADGDGLLVGHLAKANPHWKSIHDQEVLVVFHGPHAYISPTWYGEPNTVPTWNYVAVHVYGTFGLVQDKGSLKQILTDSMRFYEPSLALADRLDEPHLESMMQAIVGFKIRIHKIEGKWKLNQNHSIERQRRVIEALKQTEDPHAKEIARLMELNLPIA
ncbi:FMN-binding negative transcriptional regulator [Effusibacillus pohliae]|uniref:FMN-binding negative transcriptional regulator n=1 Tax=Effusibacillus pohliae TaxID=232270 RepID=UPI0003689C31|nr:FMN-binding negative transcriptional regulator [Effusibacillus pohliae]